LTVHQSLARVLDLLLDHWNDLLTVAAFIVALITGSYQIRHYRAEEADVKIRSVEDAEYSGRTAPQYQHPSPTSEPNRHLNLLVDTKYSVKISVENDGRENATISSVDLVIDGEKISLKNDFQSQEGAFHTVTLTENERDDLYLNGLGEVRDKYGPEIKGTLKVDTTTGELQETTTFELAS